ncbi:MAG: ABC transporter ATP-binding protein [Chlamydiae bacterium]|nr:ABC transporter ATP-binding protein [Chlamydiota bacterium]MBI3265585.1 ABC transporter ATP-binding protein [Chlamydiota bacterium]
MITFSQTLKTLYHYAKPYKREFAFGILTLFIVDFLQILPPLVLKEFIDRASLALKGEKHFSPFLWLGVAYITIAIGQSICRYFWRMFLMRGSFKVAEKIRDDYFSKLQKLPPSFYNRNTIGDLMSLATNDTEAVRFALGPGLLVLADATFFLMSIPPTLFILSYKLAFLSLAPMLMVPFIITRIEKLIHERFEKVQNQFSKLCAFSQENLEGIRIIKAFTREWTQLNRFSKIGKEFVRLNLKLARAQAAFDPLFTLAVSLGLVSLLIFAGKDVIMGSISLGTFAAFTRYLDQLVWPMTAFGLSVTYYQRGKTSLERICQVLQEKEENKTSEGNAFSIPSQINAPFLEVRHLTFTYLGSSRPVLQNINFQIQKGSRTAIVGTIGSGKSTLIRLLAGLHETPPHMIFWEGSDFSKLPLEERRKKIAFVPQDVFLFRETLRWNILMGGPFPEMKGDVWLFELLKRSGLDKEAGRWNLDLKMGERGLTLSGGERARVTLARALAVDAPLLILDDALSSVDSHTESEILHHLSHEKLSRNQTLILITHRLSKLWDFDQILVFKEGVLIQTGMPLNLAKTPGLYRELLELQRIEDELARS